MDEFLFQIEWLKKYAFNNKLDMDFQSSNTPVSKEYFININENTILGFTIEEARYFSEINFGELPKLALCFTRHLSIKFKNDFPEDLNFDFYLNKFEFDINVPIATYQESLFISFNKYFEYISCTRYVLKSENYMLKFEHKKMKKNLDILINP